MAIIDLSKLPAPNVIETLDYETLLAVRKDKLLALVPAELQSQVAYVLGLETEPLTITLQENAYRELVLRNRINDAAKAVLLAYAVGNDLDQIGARHNVERLVIVEADPTAIPPIDAVMESDDRFRQRIQMAYDGLTIAGTYGAYAFHALSSSGRVYDVKVEAPPEETLLVRINIVDTNNAGVADTNLLGMPTEGVGVSHHVIPRMSAPTFEAARFTVAGGLNSSALRWAIGSSSAMPSMRRAAGFM